MFNSKSLYKKHVHQSRKIQKDFPFLWAIKHILRQGYWSSRDGFKITIKRTPGYMFPDLLKSVPMMNDATTDKSCANRIFIHHIKSLLYWEGVTEIEAQSGQTWIQCIQRQMLNNRHHSIEHVIIVSHDIYGCKITVYRPHKDYSFCDVLGLTV